VELLSLKSILAPGPAKPVFEAADTDHKSDHPKGCSKDSRRFGLWRKSHQRTDAGQQPNTDCDANDLSNDSGYKTDR